jgi:glycosyltransferase involved in cell wall biosynthesis
MSRQLGTSEMKIPVTVLVVTLNEESNIERCLASVHDLADQLLVLDSQSKDRTVEIARRYADEVHGLIYVHDAIIPWIFQWGLDNLSIRNEWVLILEADQALSPELRAELWERFRRGGEAIEENGFYIRRQQMFRGKWIRHGGYGSKYLLKLFRRSCGGLDETEQDTHVYVHGKVRKLRHPLVEDNAKESSILFYLSKHLRYAEAFAREEYERRLGREQWKVRPSLFGRPDQRALWMRQSYYRMPLYLRAGLYFIYRYVFLLGFLDGRTGTIFHFLQAFWFRLVVDIRLAEMMEAGPARLEQRMPPRGRAAVLAEFRAGKQGGAPTP